MQSETSFRHSVVDKFLKKLENTEDFSIQQVAIRGDADKILCARGFFVWLELKKAGEDAKILQKYKASLVRKAGGISIVASPDNWKDVSQFLSLLDKGALDRALLSKINKEENV